MLSRKNYKAFADILKRAESREQIIAEFIIYLKADNPKFNEQKFKEAIA